MNNTLKLRIAELSLLTLVVVTTIAISSNVEKPEPLSFEEDTSAFTGYVFETETRDVRESYISGDKCMITFHGKQFQIISDNLDRCVATSRQVLPISEELYSQVHRY